MSKFLILAKIGQNGINTGFQIRNPHFVNFRKLPKTLNQCDQHYSMTKEALSMEPIWGLLRIFMEQLWGLRTQKVRIYGAILILFELAVFSYENQFFSKIVLIIYVSSLPK